MVLLHRFYERRYMNMIISNWITHCPKLKRNSKKPCKPTGQIYPKKLGFDIIYLSIWPMRHLCFPTGKLSKVVFFPFQFQLFSPCIVLNNFHFLSIKKLLAALGSGIVTLGLCHLLGFLLFNLGQCNELLLKRRRIFGTLEVAPARNSCCPPNLRAPAVSLE